MSGRVTLALFVIAVAMAAYIVAFERDTQSSVEALGRAGLVLERFDKEMLKEIVITRDKASLTLARKSADYDWEVTAPETLRADQPAVADLVGLWEYARPIRIVQSEDSSAAAVDLGDIRARVRFVFDTHQTEVTIAGEDPTGGLYATIGSRTVVIRPVLDESLSTDIATFKERADAGQELDRMIDEAGLGDPHEH